MRKLTPVALSVVETLTFVETGVKVWAVFVGVMVYVTPPTVDGALVALRVERWGRVVSGTGS